MRSPSESSLVVARTALNQCAVVCDWPETALDRLARGAQLRRYGRHEQVAQMDGADRRVSLVVTGAMEVSGVNVDGSRYVLSVLGPGELTGLTNLLEAAEHRYTMQARRNTTLVHIAARELRAVLDDHPLTWRSLALVALERQLGNINLLQGQALATLPQKLAQVLVRLAHWSGDRPDLHHDVVLQVSQADVAAMVGVSRQTVNKEIQALATQGLVAISYGRLTLRDLPRLRRLAAER